MIEFHRKYRPKTLKGMYGQKSAVSLLKRLLDADQLPHQLMFTGPSGCGKTTLARIIANKIGCKGSDFREVNCADFNGINMIRDVTRQARLKPMYGPARVWLVDECHMLTKEGQNAWLKALEEPPEWVYFMLATTEPAKLLKTIQNRCQEVKVELLKDDESRGLIEGVAEKEGISLTTAITDKIIREAEGSARKALVILQALVGLDDDKEKLLAIEKANARSEAYQIGVELLFKPTNWMTIAAIIKNMTDDNWEGMRMLILSMASNVLLDPKKAGLHPRAYKVMVAFSEPFYNTGKSGLVASCYEAIRK